MPRDGGSYRRRARAFWSESRTDRDRWQRGPRGELRPGGPGPVRQRAQGVQVPTDGSRARSQAPARGESVKRKASTRGARIVFVTAASDAQALAIARALVGERLAACVNIV